MDFQKILENKPLLYGIIGGIVILLAVFVTIGAVVAKNNNGGKGAARPVSEKVIKEPLELFSTEI